MRVVVGPGVTRATLILEINRVPLALTDRFLPPPFTTIINPSLEQKHIDTNHHERYYHYYYPCRMPDLSETEKRTEMLDVQRNILLQH